MQQISSSVIPNLKEDKGHIYWPNNSLNNLTKLPSEFSAHFPQIDKEWNTYCKDIKSHDKRYEEFLKRIKDSFTSAGLEWLENPSKEKSPGISHLIYEPLFVWWDERFHNSEKCTYDFEKISSVITLNGQTLTDINHIYVPGFSSAWIAYCEESDRQKCLSSIKAIALDTQYEKDAADLTSSAKALVESVSNLKLQLTDKIVGIKLGWPPTGTFWGTKEYRFKRLTACPRCKKLPK
jgi:hypothetical protein